MNLTAIAIVVLMSLTASLQALAAEPTGGQGKTLYHVVSVKLKEGTTPARVKGVEEAFVGLKAKIPGIASLHWGTNVSPENKNKGFTHCFVLTFGSEADRDVYLKHDDHKAFGKVLGPVVDDVMVIDFWSQD